MWKKKKFILELKKSSAPLCLYQIITKLHESYFSELHDGIDYFCVCVDAILDFMLNFKSAHVADMGNQGTGE